MGRTIHCFQGDKTRFLPTIISYWRRSTKLLEHWAFATILSITLYQGVRNNPHMFSTYVSKAVIPEDYNFTTSHTSPMQCRLRVLAMSKALGKSYNYSSYQTHLRSTGSECLPRARHSGSPMTLRITKLTYSVQALTTCHVQNIWEVLRYLKLLNSASWRHIKESQQHTYKQKES